SNDLPEPEDGMVGGDVTGGGGDIAEDNTSGTPIVTSLVEDADGNTYTEAQIRANNINRILDNSLSLSELNFLSDSNNLNTTKEVEAFLFKNTTSEVKTFAKQAIKALANGGEVDFDDQIINKLTGKALCVYEKLKAMSTDFKSMIQKFDGEFPVSHLKLIMEDLGTTRGVTRAPDGAGTSPDYVITIALNNNSNIHGVGYRPDLITAKTITHEVIHAEMFRKLLSLAKQGNLNFTGWTAAEQKNYIMSIKDNFPGIYDYYTRYNWNTSTPNNTQHQQMATHYRETIADILQSFDNNQHSHPFYMDLAWEGLKYSNISTWSNLSQEEKDRIGKVIDDYINANKNQNCQ
ncbi:hypothetical protein V1T75_13250, partial [Tenacibaculum sp. FZY0031]|nr:hypothetical protein [Tenacibaculum sp. FZY0031]